MPRSILSHPRISLVLAPVFAITSIALTHTARAAPPTNFPNDPNLSYERFGVFIGINHYPALDGQDLDGCVNDALTYQRIFVHDRFKVQRYVVLTNENATRDRISKAFHELIEQVKAARAHTDKTITVVITFSGHGCIVPRTDRNSPLGPGDSSWVASDSGTDGKKCIRGEEIFLVHAALRNLGAQVIMISDCCHSGTAYRGAEKARGVQLSPNAVGPVDNAFADLQKDIVLPKKPAELTSQPGFVWYAACSDREKAFEAIDQQSKQKCGRLSLVMRSVLLNATDTSYSGLFRQVAQEFTARGWTDQNPELHTAAGKENEQFFRGGFAPLHGEVLKTDPAAGTAEISLGQVHGMAQGNIFRFYANMDDALAKQNLLATGEAIDTTAGTTTVKLDRAVPLSACAMPDSVDMQDFTVALDDAAPVPEWVRRKLKELDQNKQLRLVTLSESPDVVVHHLPDDRIGLYRGNLLPAVAKGESPAQSPPPPAPLRMLSQPAKPAEYGEILATNLLYLARGHRLATLDHLPASPRTVEAQRRKLPPVSATITLVKGADQTDPIPELRQGDRFIIKVRNNITRPLYVTVFGIGPDGHVDILYPAPGEDIRPLLPDTTLEIGKDGAFVATVDDPAKNIERTQLKIITNDGAHIDFTPLTIAPETGAHNVRGAATPASRAAGKDSTLFNLVRDAMHGGELTRGLISAGLEGDWGTLTLTFDVKRKP